MVSGRPVTKFVSYKRILEVCMQGINHQAWKIEASCAPIQLKKGGPLRICFYPRPGSIFNEKRL
jgi:hypothetical protein